jgi:hypothetical protein
MGRALDKALELGLTGLESLLQRRDLLPAVARGHCCQTDQTDKWRRNFPDVYHLLPQEHEQTVNCTCL